MGVYTTSDIPWRMLPIALTVGILIGSVVALGESAGRLHPVDETASWARPQPIPDSRGPGREDGSTAGEVPGNCGDTTLTQNTDPTTVDPANTIACQSAGVTAENSFARSFAIPPGPNFVVNCVDFGVADNTGNDYLVEVRVYTGNVTGPYGSLTLLGSQSVAIPAGASGIFKADFASSNQAISVAGGSDMVVEIFAPSRLIADGGDGSGGFWIGANNAGQSAPSYARGPDCGTPDFVDAATLGVPNLHIVMRVDGGGMHYTAVTVCNNTGQAASDLHLDFTGGGGTLFVSPAMLFAPGCPARSIPTNNQITDHVDIDWGTPCVPDGACVVMIVRSARGPVALVNGEWTLNGVPIGSASGINIVPLPNFGNPPKLFQAMITQIGYQRVKVFGAWHWPGGGCWVRWVCTLDLYICYYRVIVMRFQSPIHRMWRVGNIAFASPWLPFGVIAGNDPPKYKLDFRTIRPQGPILPGPPRKPPIPPFDSPEFWDWLRDTYGVEIAYSDDNGASSQMGSGFASAFLSAWDALHVEAFDPLPELPMPTSDMLNAYGERYLAAAEILSGLVNELTGLANDTGDPSVQAALDAVTGIQVGMIGVGFQLMTGNPTDALAFSQLANSLADLASVLTGLPPTLAQQRFENAAEYLLAMAEGVALAAEMVAIGLPDTQSMDAFLWGMLNRFHPLMESFAQSMLPHVRLQLDTGPIGWTPDLVNNAWVATFDSDTGVVLHARNERINEFGHIILHIPHIDEPGADTHWVKPRTHLASIVTTPRTDGHVAKPIFFAPGDPNDDNCVDETDLQLVLDDQGAGGMDADEVPPTDVNLDGVVDPIDIEIVQLHLGSCGPPYPVVVPPCPADLNGDATVNVADLLLLLGAFGPNPGHPADLNGDNVVNVADLLLLLGLFGPCPS